MISELPTEAITTLASYIGGALSFAGLLVAAVKSKRVPVNIKFGFDTKEAPKDSGESYVTERMLRENCNGRQTDLDVKLKSSFGKMDTRLDTIVTKIDSLKDGFTEQIHQHSVDIAVIKEHMRLRRSTDRAPT